LLHTNQLPLPRSENSGRPSITNTRLAHSFPYMLKLGRAKYRGLGRHSHCESWTCTWPGLVSCKQFTRRPTPEPSPGLHRVPKQIADCALSSTIEMLLEGGSLDSNVGGAWTPCTAKGGGTRPDHAVYGYTAELYDDAAWFV
jgi:hypothetical protein